MSAEAAGWVYRHSPYRGAPFAVHLAIADSVNDQNSNEFWMGQGKLAHKARVSRKAANEAMATLLRDGYVQLLEDNSRKGRNPDGSYPPNRYRFVFHDDAAVVFDSRSGATGGYTSTPAGVTPGTPGVTTGDSSGVTHGYTEPKGGNPRGTQPRRVTAPAGDVTRQLVDLLADRLGANTGTHVDGRTRRAWVSPMGSLYAEAQGNAQAIAAVIRWVFPDNGALTDDQRFAQRVVVDAKSLHKHYRRLVPMQRAARTNTLARNADPAAVAGIR